jgi:polyribonucleotide nucleotidyltransferase
MSWGRINHPSELLKIGQKVEVKVLNIDREKEKIALGLKQREASPWEEIEKKYPVGSRVRGAVVNLMSYGAFVRSRTASRAWSTSPRCPGRVASTTRRRWCSPTRRSMSLSLRSTRTSRRSASA